MRTESVNLRRGRENNWNDVRDEIIFKLLRRQSTFLPSFHFFLINFCHKYFLQHRHTFRLHCIIQACSRALIDIIVVCLRYIALSAFYMLYAQRWFQWEGQWRRHKSPTIPNTRALLPFAGPSPNQQPSHGDPFNLSNTDCTPHFFWLPVCMDVGEGKLRYKGRESEHCKGKLRLDTLWGESQLGVTIAKEIRAWKKRKKEFERSGYKKGPLRKAAAVVLVWPCNNNTTFTLLRDSLRIVWRSSSK